MADYGMSLALETITPESFGPYGRVIAFSTEPEDERFEVVIREEVEPWRIAVFRVRQRTASRLECHPTSMESFEPMSGVGVLLAAEPLNPGEVHAFLLDQPICLWKGVWHEVVTLSNEALYKVTENKDVHSEFHTLSHPLKIAVINT